MICCGEARLIVESAILTSIGCNVTRFNSLGFYGRDIYLTMELEDCHQSLVT